MAPPLSARSLCFKAASRAVSTARSYSSINCNTQFNICFVRHGQSTWNRDNRFIGWTDTPLTEDGVLEARVAGRMLQSSGILFDEAHTVRSPFLSVMCNTPYNDFPQDAYAPIQSLLRRCIRTTNLILMEMGQVGAHRYHQERSGNVLSTKSHYLTPYLHAGIYPGE